MILFNFMFLGITEARPVEFDVNRSVENINQTRGPASVNQYMRESNSEIEEKRNTIEIGNSRALPVSEGIEFQQPEVTRSHGVDMQLAPSLPSFEYRSSYTPKTLDAQIEAEIQDAQTTDFVVERKWQKIRRKINSERHYR